MPFTRTVSLSGDLVRYEYNDATGRKLDGLSFGAEYEKTDIAKQQLIAWVVKWIQPGEKHPALLQTRDLVLKAMEDF